MSSGVCEAIQSAVLTCPRCVIAVLPPRLAVAQISALVSSSVTLRDELLLRGILPELFDACSLAVFFLSAAACLESFTRLAPQSRFSELREMLPTLAQLLYVADEEALTHSLTALAALSDEAAGSDHPQIQAVIVTGVCRRVVELLMHKSTRVKTAALAIVVHLTRGDDVHRQELLNCSVLPCLLALTVHAERAIRACVAQSQLRLGNVDQLYQVIESNAVPSLLLILRNEEGDVQRAALTAIARILTRGSDEQVRYLVKQGAIGALCTLLTHRDCDVILLALVVSNRFCVSARRMHRRTRGTKTISTRRCWMSAVAWIRSRRCKCMRTNKFSRKQGRFSEPTPTPRKRRTNERHWSGGRSLRLIGQPTSSAGYICNRMGRSLALQQYDLRLQISRHSTVERCMRGCRSPKDMAPRARGECGGHRTHSAIPHPATEQNKERKRERSHEGAWLPQHVGGSSLSRTSRARVFDRDTHTLP